MTDRIYTLHHLPASGGTIMTRAIAAMQGCVVLSEVHPDRTFWTAFHPLVQITRGYNLLSEAEIRRLDDLFMKDIEFIHRAASERGLNLVIRDHTFVDFMARNRLYSRLVEVLQRHYTVVPLVTTRDPVDVWISCALNKWLGSLTPDTFCFRYRKMLECFAGTPRLRYEDFVADPPAVLQKTCRLFNLAFDPDFPEKMKHIKHITGDSGRRSMTIGPRPRRWGNLAPDAATAFLASEHYRLLCQETGYPPLTQEDVDRHLTESPDSP